LGHKEAVANSVKKVRVFVPFPSWLSKNSNCWEILEMWQP
jgi:hypothetical protein